MHDDRIGATPEARVIDGALARGFGAVALFGVIAGVARIGQDAAIAARLGTGALVDAYYFLFALVQWPPLVALAVLMVLVAPIEAACGASVRSTLRFRAELLGAMIGVAVISLPLTAWGLQLVVDSAAAGLPPATAAAAHAGVPGVVAVVPIGLVGALLAAWLVAGGRHVLTLLEALPPLVLAAWALALPTSTLFWGSTAGVVVQLLVMALLLQRTGELPLPRLSVSAGEWQRFLQGACVLLVGQALFALVPFVDTLFAARAGAGEVAALSYANRLALGLQGLGGLAMQRAGLPLLVGLSAGAPAALRRAALRWALAAGCAGAIAGLLIAALALPLVALLFERGSFSPADTSHVATLLRYGMLQMAPFLASMALVTALAAAHARRALARIAAVGIGLKVVLNAALVPGLGVAGVQVASAVMYAAIGVLAWLALRRGEQPAIR